MSLIEQNFVTDENEIKKQIKITNHEKSEIENEHIKAKADYDITKKEMEEIINKTRLKYIESQDKIIFAQKKLSKKRTSTARVKSLSFKKLNELDTNKINLNTNKNNQNEKNILTSSTSPTINDINKKQIGKNNSNK